MGVLDLVRAGAPRGVGGWWAPPQQRQLGWGQMPLTALVTGANGVFGRHIVAGLAAKGYEVVAVVRDEAKGKALVESVGGGASFLVADLTSPAQISALASGFGDRPLCALVNNAAITPTSRQESAEGEELQWACNVLGYHRVVRALLPQLRLAAAEAEGAGGGAAAPRAVFVASFCECSRSLRVFLRPQVGCTHRRRRPQPRRPGIQEDFI